MGRCCAHTQSVVLTNALDKHYNTLSLLDQEELNHITRYWFTNHARKGAVSTSARRPGYGITTVELRALLAPILLALCWEVVLPMSAPAPNGRQHPLPGGLTCGRAARGGPMAIRLQRLEMGGERPWCRCAGCHRCVVVLCDVGKWYLCRYCYERSYGSQQETAEDRHYRTLRKIRGRVSASGHASRSPRLSRPTISAVSMEW